MRILLEWLDVYGLTADFLGRRKYKLLSVAIPCLLLVSAYTSFNTRSLVNALDSVYVPASTPHMCKRQPVSRNSEANPCSNCRHRMGCPQFSLLWGLVQCPRMRLSRKPAIVWHRPCISKHVANPLKGGRPSGMSSSTGCATSVIRVLSATWFSKASSVATNASSPLPVMADRTAPIIKNSGMPLMTWPVNCWSKAPTHRLPVWPHITMLTMWLPNGHPTWSRSQKSDDIFFMWKIPGATNLPRSNVRKTTFSRLFLDPVQDQGRGRNG